MSIAKDLARRAAEGRPVRIGLIGAGEMGTDILTQVRLMAGIEVVAVASRDPNVALNALDICGRGRAGGEVCAGGEALGAAIRAGRIAVTAASDHVCAAPEVDVIVDATGNPNAGAEIGIAAIRAKKPIVMMNVEADVTIGPYLAAEAAGAGVAYSLGAGDEPSSTMELIEFARALGYPIVAAGKGKNNPLNVDAVPADYAAEAKARNMNPRMLVEFVDGSKTMIEMTALANATGLVPDRPGMHGPAATIDTLETIFRPRADGGILSQAGVVEYTIGKGVAPGVFVVVKAPHDRIDERMRDLKVGKGPYFTFYRPFHLTSLEVPLTAADLVVNARPAMVPLARPVAEATALAKRALKPGERLRRIGEDQYRGYIHRADQARAERLLPIGLAEHAEVIAPIAAGSPLTYDNCALDPALAIVALRRAQDEAAGHAWRDGASGPGAAAPRKAASG